MISSSSLLAVVVAVAFIAAAPSLTVVALDPACQLAGCQGDKAVSKANATIPLSGGGNATSSSSFVVVPEVLIHANHHKETPPVAVDLPNTMMKQHVRTIQVYLENPVQCLEKMNLELATDDDKERLDDDAILLSDKSLLATLEDLGEQLIHADKAREFYALGGWPLLASLVSSKVHASVVSLNVKNDNDALTEKILAIRAHAAWAMGSAIKGRVHEFGPWVQEEIMLMGDDDDDEATVTTPLEIVVQALLEVSDAAASPGSCSKSTLHFQEQLAVKTVYALGSFLRGNSLAQVAFSNMLHNPAQILGTQVSKWVQEATETAAMISSNAPMSRHAIKMTQQLLTLANDIVADNGTKNNFHVIINEFTSDTWCQAAMQASTMKPSSNFKRLVFKSLHNTAIQTVQTLGPYCSYSYTNDETMIIRQ